MGQRPAGKNSNAPEVLFKTGSIYSSQDGLVMTGTVAGKQCNITVDTGSNVSIVRPDILRSTTRDSLE